MELFYLIIYILKCLVAAVSAVFFMFLKIERVLPKPVETAGVLCLPLGVILIWVDVIGGML